jgi:serine/threonine protein kinase
MIENTFCLRFNIATGKYPFEGDNIFKLFEKIGEGVFEIPEEVDELLGDLLKGMLHKDPYLRFSLPEVQHHGYHRIREIQKSYTSLLFWQLVYQEASAK